MLLALPVESWCSYSSPLTDSEKIEEQTKVINQAVIVSYATTPLDTWSTYGYMCMDGDVCKTYIVWLHFGTFVHQRFFRFLQNVLLYRLEGKKLNHKLSSPFFFNSFKSSSRIIPIFIM